MAADSPASRLHFVSDKTSLSPAVLGLSLASISGAIMGFVAALALGLVL